MNTRLSNSISDILDLIFYILVGALIIGALWSFFHFMGGFLVAIIKILIIFLGIWLTFSGSKIPEKDKQITYGEYWQKVFTYTEEVNKKNKISIENESIQKIAIFWLSAFLLPVILSPIIVITMPEFQIMPTNVLGILTASLAAFNWYKSIKSFSDGKKPENSQKFIYKKSFLEKSSKFFLQLSSVAFYISAVLVYFKVLPL